MDRTASSFITPTNQIRTRVHHSNTHTNTHIIIEHTHTRTYAHIYMKLGLICNDNRRARKPLVSPTRFPYHIIYTDFFFYRFLIVSI